MNWSAFCARYNIHKGTLAKQLSRGYCQWPRRIQDGRQGHYLKSRYDKIKDRTTRSTYKEYQYYGGRGIRMCTAWYVSFEQFVRDIEALGPRPEGYSLDRIDNNGHYEPGNVRWASKQTQRHNQRPRKDSGLAVGLTWREDAKVWRYRSPTYHTQRISRSFPCPVLGVIYMKENYLC